MNIFKKIILKLPVLTFDTLSIFSAWYLAFCLQNKHPQMIPYHFNTWTSWLGLTILVGLQLTCYYHFKVYRGLWRFSSLKDVSRIIRAVACAVGLAIPIFYVTGLLSRLPYNILPLHAIILIGILCSVRLYFRIKADLKPDMPAKPQNSQKVLIVGAGQAGESLIRDLQRTSTYQPVGIVDDNRSKIGLEIHGVRVLGTTSNLLEFAEKYFIDLIFIAIPSLRSASMRRIMNYCSRCRVPVRTLPSLQALASGLVQINALREVNIEDLLGRDQVALDWYKISNLIENKRVVVTGGGGSIGSELCRQIMRLNPDKLFILDHSEYNLYRIEMDLKAKYDSKKIELALISVIDKVAIAHYFQQFKPDIIFHAAAYKHVPLVEDQIRAGILNNVIGTKIVAEAAIAMEVDKFILISTDKAVNPTNVMGASKRVAEIYCQNVNARVKTQFITVRFGNVLGSVGSVVPLFQKQLKQGGPLTVTHPDIERYFMTISEACQLILQAMANGAGEEIFVLDMGEPVKIAYLAEQMIRLAGKEPGKDIKIEYTGLRPGEKLFEELFHASEKLTPTAHEKLFKAKFRSIDWDELTQAIHLIEAACMNYQTDELLILLKNLVPEFHSDKYFKQMFPLKSHELA